MKVVQVIDSLKVGGAQRLMTVFAQEMLRCGYSVQIISLNSPESESPIFQELIKLDVKITHIPLRSIVDIRGFRKLCTAIGSSGAEIVHTQLNYANIHGTIAAHWLGIPSVASLHNASVHLFRQKPYRTWLETRALSRYSREIIACSQTVGRVQQPRFKGRVLKIIPNPVPNQTPVSARRIRELRAEFLPDGTGLLVISVGRLIPEKGYPDLIRAFKLARKKLDLPMRLLIAGKGYLLNDLRADAEKAGQNDAVVFLGERSDIADLLAASDIYAGASHYEGQSLAVLEAMQSGLALVVTDVGDNRQVVAEGCGVVLPPGRVDLLVDEIVRLANNPAERKRMGKNASRFVRAKYSPSIWVDRLLELYGEVLHA